jgi:hypothetical protein
VAVGATRGHEVVVVSQVSESKPGAPLFVLLDGFFKAMMRAHGIAHGHEMLFGAGKVSCFPRSSAAADET